MGKRKTNSGHNFRVLFLFKSVFPALCNMSLTYNFCFVGVFKYTMNLCEKLYQVGHFFWREKAWLEHLGILDHSYVADVLDFSLW